MPGQVSRVYWEELGSNCDRKFDRRAISFSWDQVCTSGSYAHNFRDLCISKWLACVQVPLLLFVKKRTNPHINRLYHRRNTAVKWGKKLFYTSIRLNFEQRTNKCGASHTFTRNRELTGSKNVNKHTARHARKRETCARVGRRSQI